MMTASAASSSFVTDLYASILLRGASDIASAATQGAIGTWASFIDAGTVSQAQVVAAFENSSEFTTYVLPIVRLYEAFFQRAPDGPGLSGWVNLYRSGAMTLTQIADGFVGSIEFAHIFGSSNPSSSVFITALYNNILDRAPISSEIAGWQAAIEGGSLSLAQVALGFSNSPEYLSYTTTANDAWFTTAAANAQAGVTSIYPASIPLFTPPTLATLTISADNITGTNIWVSGTFNGAGATFGSGDQVHLGGAFNALSLVSLSSIPFSFANGFAGVTISGVQTANISSNGAVSIDTVTDSPGWTSLLTLNVSEASGAAGSAVTAGATTGISVVDTTLSNGVLTVDGGSNVNLTVGGIGAGGAITVGGTSAPTGTVAIAASDTPAASGTVVTITVNGGGNDTITDAGNGTINVTLGGGNDAVTLSGSGSHMIAVGPHTPGGDSFRVGVNGSLTTLSTISGALAGDIVYLSTSSGAFHATAVSQTNVTAAGGDPNSISGWVAGAMSTNSGALGIANGDVAWFAFQGDTYIVQQGNSVGSAFGAGDTLIKLVGALDLSHGSFAVSGMLTL